MAISDYYNKTATLTKKSQSSTNEYGEPSFTESTSSLSCAIQPVSKIGGTVGLSIVERGKVITSTHALFCAVSETIEAGDKVTVDGNDYDVILVNDDAGRGHHLLCGLRLVS